jgi:hypothetical protein
MDADEWLNNLMFTQPSISAIEAIARLPRYEVASAAYEAYSRTAQQVN